MADERTQEQVNEEQARLLQELEKTGWKIDDDPKFKGVIRDMQQERKSRQTMEEQLTATREENTLYAEQLAKMKNTDDEEEEEDDDDDGFLTKKQAREMLDKAISQGKEASAAQRASEVQMRMRDSEEKAKAELTADKVGEGLDYDTVIREGYAKMVKKNPAYHQVVLNSENPAEEAYRIGLLEPSMSKKVDTRKNDEFVGKLRTEGGRGIPKASLAALNEEESYEQLLKMPESEIERSLRNEEK